MSTPAKELGERFELWKLAFKGDDHNSIQNQVFTLTWDAAAFGMINECRRLDQSRENSALNPLVQDLIGRSYVASQFSRLRRLADDRYDLVLNKSKPANKDLSVFSLKSLIKDIQDHRHLLTRRNIFELESLEYDVDIAEQLEWEYIFAREKGDVNVPMEISAYPTTSLHEHWDRLSGVSSEARSESDVPKDSIFRKYNEFIVSVAPARDWATVFIAHASSPASRESTGKGVAVTWNELEAMTASIVKVCGAISEMFFRVDVTRWIAYPQRDIVSHMEKPWCNKDEADMLREWWRGYEKKVESWTETEFFFN